MFCISLVALRFRNVAITLCPARASVTAVANPMLLLVRVTNAIAITVTRGATHRTLSKR
jgi:hypothetical protein